MTKPIDPLGRFLSPATTSLLRSEARRRLWKTKSYRDAQARSRRQATLDNLKIGQNPTPEIRQRVSEGVKRTWDSMTPEQRAWRGQMVSLGRKRARK